MKIKEVMEKTDLTERAIRLYIENGLVAPSVNESYSGRRNIEFSDEDVKRLKSISVLRKAGFSIAQIKLLMHQPEKSKDVLREFIDDTTAKIESDREILSCLIPLLDVEKLDPELISRSLEKPVVEEKSIPTEDNEPTPLQKFIRKLFFGVGVAGLAFTLLCAVLILRVEVRDWISYLYPTYSLHSLVFFIWLLGAFIFAIAVVFINKKSKLRTRKGLGVKNVVSAVLVGLLVWFSVFNFTFAFLSFWGSTPESYVVSRTDKVKNYMIFDDAEAKEALLEFLPEELPDAEFVEYKYFYKSYGSAPVDPQTEIFVEIFLDTESFNEIVEKYKAFRPSDSVCEPYEEKINDWTRICYREDYEKAPTNYDAVFAYNERLEIVRFICEYGNVDTKGAGIHKGYHYGKADYKW